MALKITLKPNEKMILGGTVVVNGSSMSSDLIIEYRVSIYAKKIFLAKKMPIRRAKGYTSLSNSCTLMKKTGTSTKISI